MQQLAFIVIISCPIWISISHAGASMRVQTYRYFSTLWPHCAYRRSIRHSLRLLDETCSAANHLSNHCWVIGEQYPYCAVTNFVSLPRVADDNDRIRLIFPITVYIFRVIAAWHFPVSRSPQRSTCQLGRDWNKSQISVGQPRPTCHKAEQPAATLNKSLSRKSLTSSVAFCGPREKTASNIKSWLSFTKNV